MQAVLCRPCAMEFSDVNHKESEIKMKEEYERERKTEWAKERERVRRKERKLISEQ